MNSNQIVTAIFEEIKGLTEKHRNELPENVTIESKCSSIVLASGAIECFINDENNELPDNIKTEVKEIFNKYR